MQERKFPFSFFILLTQWHEFFAPKLTNFHIFVMTLPLNLTLFSKSPYLTAHIKINETSCNGRLSEKHKDVSQTIATFKMVFFVALVRSFQSLTNFSRNHNIGAIGVLNVPIEWYNVFWNLRRWSNEVLQNYNQQLF